MIFFKDMKNMILRHDAHDDETWIMIMSPWANPYHVNVLGEVLLIKNVWVLMTNARNYGCQRMIWVVTCTVNSSIPLGYILENYGMDSNASICYVCFITPARWWDGLTNGTKIGLDVLISGYVNYLRNSTLWLIICGYVII